MSEKDDIQERLKSIGDAKDSIEWVLTKQAELRAELLTFFKKDIKEIDAAISDILKDVKNDSQPSFREDVLKEAKEHYLRHWDLSFGLVSPMGSELQKQPEPVKQAGKST